MRYCALLCTIVLVGCADATAPAPPSAPPAARSDLVPRDANLDASWTSPLSGPTIVPFSVIACNGTEIVIGQAQQTIFTKTFTQNGKTFAITAIFQRVNATDTQGRKYVGSNLMVTSSLVTPGTNTLALFGDLDLFAVNEIAPDIFVDVTDILVNGVPTKVSFTTRCPAS